MIEYVKASHSDKAEIIEFINLVFSMAHRPHDFKTVLPKTYGDGAIQVIRAEHYVARDHGKLVGVVGLMPGELRVCGETLKTGVIGSVSTHPYDRRGGHMRACMSLMLEDARAMGLQLLSLGGQRQRYEYFGFTPGGLGYRFHLNGSNFRHACPSVDDAPYAFRELSDGDDEAIRGAAALHESQIAYAARGEAGFLSIAHTWGNRLYAIEKVGAFAGYLIADRDAKDVDEIGLIDPGDRLGVLKAWHRISNQNFEVILPPTETAAIRELGRIAEACAAERCGMYNILDYKAVLRAHLKLKSKLARLPEGEFAFAVDGGRPVALSLRGGVARAEETDRAPDASLAHIEAVNLFVSAMPWTDVSRLPALAEAWFPLPVAIGGVDSF